MSQKHIPIQFLGQSGCRLDFPDAVIYVDPYLSNSVQELDAQDLERLLPIPTCPENVTDATWVLITHDHIDHCDPHTLPKLAVASPQCLFLGPPPVLARLKEWGVAPNRLHQAQESWGDLEFGLRVHAVPAAHPTILRDHAGHSLCIGFILEYAGSRVYFAGDTTITQELLDILRCHLPISTAILPVNEQNFFRSRRGIIGNMSVREAFLLAEEMHIAHVVPVHWDMFVANAVYPDEIKVVYRHMHPNFELLLQPEFLPL